VNQAYDSLFAGDADVMATTESYKEYARCIKTIADGAIKIGAKFNDKNFTNSTKKETQSGLSQLAGD
jgi:hypothetical protein